MTSRRTLLFAVYSLGLLALHWTVLRALVDLASVNSAASHTLLVPFIALAMMYERRKRIASTAQSFDVAGAAVGVIGVLLAVTAFLGRTSYIRNVHLTIAIAALVLLWIGGFMFVYGRRAVGAAGFPLVFLAFMIPFPPAMVDAITSFLKIGSAKTVAVLFTITGTPFHENGFAFLLPGFTIEIADECSGIRSSIALMLTSLMGGQLFLGRIRNQLLLAAAVLPLALLKNGIRIVGLSLLASHVDPGFLTGQLHHEGGIAFFLLVLPVVALIIAVLRRAEAPTFFSS